jgi:hypothetical protein
VTSARRYFIKRLDFDYFVTDEDETTSAVTPEAAVDQ